jgi:signal transduction histidine kinase
MLKLFLKTYGLLIAILAASFLIQLVVTAWLSMTMPKADVAGRFSATFHLIERELSARPPAEWQAHLAELRMGFRTQVTLLTLDEIHARFGMQAGDQLKLAAREVVAFEREGGGFFLARRLAESDVATLLELPGPRSQRVFLNILNWMLEMVVVAVLLAFWIRPFWRDLNNLSNAAQAAGGGDFGVRPLVGPLSPLKHLADGFNSMTERINELLSAHRQLTTAVSHELRNPLMRLRFRQSLALEAESAADKNRNLDEMEAALNELDQLVEEILTYARTKNPGQDIEIAPVETAAWLKPLESNARALAEAQRRPMQIETGGIPPKIEIEPVFMARALSNLLSNAVQYAAGQVRLTIERKAGQHRLMVDDDGPGVPEKDRVNVFEPFWRGDQSRNRKTGGFGIGLALVQRIARWHGGDASVSKSPLGGARFEMTWPIKEEVLSD